MDGKLTEKLIQSVKRRPVLYLYKHPEYKNKAKTLQAWKGIQAELNEEVDVIKSRWKNLKDTYKKCKNSRQGTGSLKLANWTWADHMSFLDATILDGTVTIKEELSSENEESDNDLNSNSSNNRETENSQPEDVLKSYEMTVFQNSNKKYLSLKRKRSEQEKGKDRTNTRNRTRSSDDRDNNVEVSCDRVDLLFLGLANSFKKLSRRTQITAKFNLVKVLMDAELSDLRDDE